MSEKSDVWLKLNHLSKDEQLEFIKAYKEWYYEIY